MKKVCSKCRKEKDVEEFTVGKVGKKGQKYYGHCKICHAQYNKKSTEELSDKYIKEKLKERGFDQQTVNEIPQLIEIKRQSIRLKRQIWQQLKISTTSSNS